MIAQLKSLHELGFGVICLHKKEKRPIDNAWQTGARKTWKELSAQFRSGMNLGVRMGKASVIGENFLAVIDCDVKSADPKHVAEMRSALDELFPLEDMDAFPCTRSGRGNGSMHLWCLTASPASSQRLAQSGEKVKVLMPKAKATPVNTQGLSAAEIKQGYRLRAAWEVSLMGEGSQVVLPPSIHPDTGRAYAWARPIAGVESIPLITPPKGLGREKSADRDAGASDLKEFKPTTVQLASCGLPDRIVTLIEEGNGSGDRSAELYAATIALVRHGMSDADILTLLTEPNTYLGEACYDHTSSRNRSRAARWLLNHTVVTARKKYDEALSFNPIIEGNEENAPLLTEAESKAQTETLTAKDWRDAIERSSEKDGSTPRKTLKNIVTILQGEFGKACYKLNEFSGFTLHGEKMPWAKAGDEITDTHATQIKIWLARRYRFEPQVNVINEAMCVIAAENRFHPVREYLDTLEWDGTPRMDTWLKRHLSAVAPAKYLTAVSRKVLVAMVARIYEPGRKFDQVLILEGPQGIGKSRSIKALAGPEWSSDAPINLLDKDGVLAMRAVWLMELGELSGMRKADVDQLKEFVSRPVDRIRVPYGHHMQTFPRQCIFVGTTNNAEYLKDTTGNRRFWPVMVGDCHVDELAAERNHLLAEAKFAYDMGEVLWIDDENARLEAEGEQASRVFMDEWIEVLKSFFEEANPDTNFPFGMFQLRDLFGDNGPAEMRSEKMDRGAQLRMAECLRVLGYTKGNRRSEKGTQGKHWIKK